MTTPRRFSAGILLIAHPLDHPANADRITELDRLIARKVVAAGSPSVIPLPDQFEDWPQIYATMITRTVEEQPNDNPTE